METIEGMKCPECGHTKSFDIEVGIWCEFGAYGVTSTGDHSEEWDSGSLAECGNPDCDFKGTVADFLDADAQSATEPGQHTPGGAWTYDGGVRGGCIMPDNVYSSPLTIHHEWGDPTPEGAIATANMKHIVLAVNCHDDLLAACKAVIDPRNRWIGEVPCSIIDALILAIAKAEAKPTC